MSLIRKHGAVLQAWACLDLVYSTMNTLYAATCEFAGRLHMCEKLR